MYILNRQLIYRSVSGLIGLMLIMSGGVRGISVLLINFAVNMLNKFVPI